jgi:hypothetical protein
MTMNVSDMTCEQVNEAIRVLRPLDPPTVSMQLVKPETAEFVGHTRYPPDYCHDWAACGPLLEEMVNASVLDVSCWKGPRDYHVAPSFQDAVPVYASTDRQNSQGTSKDALPEAIARAWLKWRTV